MTHKRHHGDKLCLSSVVMSESCHQPIGHGYVNSSFQEFAVPDGVLPITKDSLQCVHAADVLPQVFCLVSQTRVLLFMALPVSCESTVCSK